MPNPKTISFLHVTMRCTRLPLLHGRDEPDRLESKPTLIVASLQSAARDCPCLTVLKAHLMKRWLQKCWLQNDFLLYLKLFSLQTNLLIISYYIVYKCRKLMCVCINIYIYINIYYVGILRMRCVSFGIFFLFCSCKVLPMEHFLRIAEVHAAQAAWPCWSAADMQAERRCCCWWARLLSLSLCRGADSAEEPLMKHFAGAPSLKLKRCSCC